MDQLSQAVLDTLLHAEIYPDSDDTTSLGDGADGVYDRVEYKYNRQGERVETKDQNETVHQFEYDPLGRLIRDKITLAQGSDVDDDVLRIERAYEIRGMLEKISSYDAAVNTSTSPKVQYSYANGSSGHVPRTKITYPNGRELNFYYGTSGSTSDAMNRVESLKDNGGSTELAKYIQYIWGERYIDDLILRDRDADTERTLDDWHLRRFFSPAASRLRSPWSWCGRGLRRTRPAQSRMDQAGQTPEEGDAISVELVGSQRGHLRAIKVKARFHCLCDAVNRHLSQRNPGEAVCFRSADCWWLPAK